MNEPATNGEIYSFDAAKIGHCPNCHVEVRMFTGAQWWVDGRSPPPFTGWWCPDCLHEKCVQAAKGIVHA